MRNYKFVLLLKRARKTIAQEWDHYMDPKEYPSPYICDNIDKAAESLWPNSNDYEAADRLTDLITARMDNAYGLQHWLRDNKHMSQLEYASFTTNPKVFNKLQATRLAWIDSLIEEFS